MSPPVEEWPATELPFRVYSKTNGRRRKGDVDLSKCPLYELVQYECEPEPAPEGNGKKLIRCQQIVRTFRKCENFMAEVTALEGKQRR